MRSLIITDQAVVRLREQSQDGHHIRISVTGAGCSDQSYSIIYEPEQEVGEHDEKEVRDGVFIVLDPKSRLYLNGAVLDFWDDVVNQRFVIQKDGKTICDGVKLSVSQKKRKKH